MIKKTLLPLTYLGNVHVFAHVVNSEQILIEQHANYQRKSYINRCNITGANGPLKLAIPIVNVKNEKTRIKDTLISYDTNWQKQHWRSIVSAYNSSPFFEYYADDFAPFYEKPYKYLLDFIMGLFRVMMEELELETDIALTESFSDYEGENINDLRRLNSIKGNLNDPTYQQVEYKQVFSEKYPFVPNLSVIDLLFSKGPETYDILKQSIKL